LEGAYVGDFGFPADSSHQAGQDSAGAFRTVSIERRANSLRILPSAVSQETP